MPDAHVIPDGDRWTVKQADGGEISAHDTQSEAEQAGKDWASDNGGGEVRVHRDEGDFARIRKSDSV